MSDVSQGPGWWMASDGKWYPPQPARLTSDDPTAPIPVVPMPNTAGGYRAWPLWARIAAPAGAVFVLLVIIGVIIGPAKKKPAATVVKLDPTSAYLTAIRSSATGSLIKTAPDAALTGLGQGVCSKLAGEDPGRVEADMLAGSKGQDFPPSDAASLITVAVKNLCPDRASAVKSWDKKAAAAPTTALAVAPIPTTSPPPTVPKSQLDAAKYVNHIATAVGIINNNIDVVLIDIVQISKNDPSVSIQDLSDAVATAHSQLDNYRYSFGGAPGFLSDASTNLSLGAESMKNALGALRQYIDTQEPSHLSDFKSQYNEGVQEWNDALTTVYTAAAMTPPTLPTN